jgi:amino acid adenylation domain-containing protein
VRRLSERLEALSPGKRAMLEEQLAPRRRTHPPKADLERISRKGVLELSFAQERMWFLHRLEPNGRSYNLSGALRLTGQLKVAALKQCLNEVTRRHEVLRTTFGQEDGRPRLVIRESINIDLDVTDLRSLADPQAGARIEASLEAGRPFDLGTGPLLRARLLRLGDDEYVLLMTMHHIVSDAWSIAILSQEVSALYTAYSSGQPSPLHELAIQYADYANWQRQWLQGEVLQGQLSYWARQLAGAPPALDLPTDRPRPSIQANRGTTHEFRIDGGLTQRLHTLSRLNGTTLFMTLLTAFGILLSRYTGQADIVVGTPIANRTRTETERLIGLFANTLAFRINMFGSLTVRELLGRMKQTALDAYEHQDLPFEKLVAELQTPRDMSRSPLFQVMCALQNAPASPLKLAGLAVERFERCRESAMFDMTLDLTEVGGDLAGIVEFNTDLFDASTIARMAGHLRVLLEAMATGADLPVHSLAMLTEPERHRTVVEWNNTAADYPVGVRLHEQFEVQASQTPEAIAVECASASVTYRELELRANGVAHSLRAHGVGRHALVGLCVERSVEMVVGLLGILKAGAAYLPIDPSLPAGRIAHMLSDGQVQVVLTEEGVCGVLAESKARARVLTIDALGRPSSERLEVPGRGEDLGYVMYTSGSTGTPKGVQVTHRSIVNLLESMCREPGLNKRDRLLSVTTLSFDISGLEIYLPLIVGARVVIADKATAMDAYKLMALMETSTATVMQATPATWRMLLDAGWQGSAHIKVLCGGEGLPQGLSDELCERSSSAWNVYGPTETTIWSSVQRLEERRPVVAGRPIANTHLYVLDERLEVAPSGVIGELYIGGDGLARGYQKREELTAERFVPDPFGWGDRMYRTGDRARWRWDGTIEIVGRVDHQVKLRGFRIELGEIESTLRRHPGVLESLVQVHDASGSGLQLVAYVRPKESIPITELRGYLAEELPAHMMPSAFVLVSDWPLTPHGKIDRRALPTPDVTSRAAADYMGPRDPFEEALSTIWREVLNIPRVGIHDNFFELGGHSLLVTQVVARARRRLNLDLSVRSVFDHPTIADLVRATGGDNTETGEI